LSSLHVADWLGTNVTLAGDSRSLESFPAQLFKTITNNVADAYLVQDCREAEIRLSSLSSF
jgi:hypothetical protein